MGSDIVAGSWRVIVTSMFHQTKKYEKDLVDLLHFSLESTIHQGVGKTKREQYE